MPIALGWDRSGHRLAGPAISMGAKYIGEDGMPAVIDDGFKAMTSRIAKWHEEGTMPKEIWGGVAGQTYAALNEEFANGNVVMYESGSWQIGQFTKTIGDAFDWWAIPAPCGPAACSGLPGGAAVVAIKYTQHPAEVAKLMEWLASEPVMKEFAERTLFIPGHEALAEKGLDFQTDNESAKRALDVFVDGDGEVRAGRQAHAVLPVGGRDLRRHHHPHGPGRGRRDHARRRLCAHSGGHRAEDRGSRQVTA